MKYKIIFFSLLFILCSTKKNLAQENKSIKIENIAEKTVWPSVYKTFQELKLPRPIIDKQSGTGQTNYYNYTSLIIKNRLRFKFEYEYGILTITLFERQYQTDNGWADNPLPMSKKKAEKILNPIKKRIVELTKDKPYIDTSQITQAKQESDKEKAGIYDSFVIVKTDDDKMDLLAIHENGNIMGFDLSEDKKMVKSLIFKENEDAEAVIMLFNNEGFPKGLVTNEYAVNIKPAENNIVELSIYDLNGNFISTEQTELQDLESFSITIEQEKEGKGPGNSSIIFVIDLKNMSKYLGYASTALQTVTCVGLVASGAGVPLAAVTCGSALVDLTVQVLPKENFLYDELELLSEVSALIPTKSPLAFVKLFENFDRANKLLVGLKRLTSSSSDLLDKYFPEDKVVVENNSEIVSESTTQNSKPKNNKPAIIKKAWEEDENSLPEEETSYRNNFSLDNTSPGKTMVLLIDLFKNNEFEKAASLYVGPDGEQFSEDDFKKMEGLLAMASEKQKKQGESFKKVTINKETISEDGKTAIVNSTMENSNNETTTQDNKLFNIDGKWYVSIK